MKEFKILKILDKISFIFKSVDIDYPLMRKIIQIKLLMDERRVPTVMMNNKSNAQAKNSFRSSLLLYLFVGGFIGLFIFIPLPIFIKMNIILGMLIFMIMTTMISDFSTVLLDIEDKNILLPRPVDAKTLNMAKLIHILIYLIGITFAITGGTLLFGTIRFGIAFFLLMLFEIILICSFSLFVTSLLYYAILAIFSGEKLKDIINYFQIALSIFMTISYQMIGRIFNIATINVEVKKHVWDFLLPTAWFAAPFHILLNQEFDIHYIILGALAIIIPTVTLIIYSKVVAPNFEKKLQKINNSEGRVKRKERKEARQRAIAAFFCRTNVEKTFFRFTLQMLNNERKLKLRIYPLLGLAVIFPFIFMFQFFNAGNTFLEAYTQITSGRYYLYLYYTASLLASLFTMISLSENYQGAWIYKVLPLDDPTVLLKGAFKAFVYKYIVPVYLFVSVIFMAAFGVKIADDLILIFVNLLILMLAMFKIMKKEMPFYKDFQYAQNSSNSAKVFLSFILCAGEALVHYIACRFVPFGVELNLIVSVLILIFLWYISFQFTWKEVVRDSQ
ncbi:hypothetical protein [Lachnotalea glycerini]|jgi:hypothetical protein|uniref:ABC transporter permease n=1 Tax=Lachnotalea glycerini TaxID=1763509 RepID=A0A371JA57_9FIRM|nr:hypothetical protein [Lachnotalea glycerini]RDY29538.1 ABC transporter permease [Lachnotalea glycerini]